MGLDPALSCQSDVCRPSTFGQDFTGSKPFFILHMPKKNKGNTTHGHAGIKQRSPSYHTWNSMRQRCKNSSRENYKDYGARGITVCERWEFFENFLADMGERPKGMTLDRKDNDKGYYLENCRWATPEKQVNNRRNNVNLTFNGETKNITQWANEIRMPKSTLRNRILKLGWPVEKALTYNSPLKF